jgi:hypothetical protein
MSQRQRKWPVSRILLLACGLVALGLTLHGFYPSLRLYARVPGVTLRRLALDLWMLATYWVRFALWAVGSGGRPFFPHPANPLVMWQSAALRPWHLGAQMGAVGLAAMYAGSLRRSGWLWAGLSLLFPGVAPLVLCLLGPKLLSGVGETHQCAQCGLEHVGGKQYTFHYGRRASASGDYAIPLLGSRTTYRIMGSDGAWLCRSCVAGQFAGSYLAIVAFVSALYFEEGWSAGLVGLASGLFLASFFVYLFRIFFGLGGIGVLGERLAIKVRRARLEALGADSFFDRAQHERLEKSR